MTNVTGDNDEYPPSVPLEDEPERFIEGSPESDEIERDEPGTDDSRDDGAGEDPEVPDTIVNDG